MNLNRILRYSKVCAKIHGPCSPYPVHGLIRSFNTFSCLLSRFNARHTSNISEANTKYQISSREDHVHKEKSLMERIFDKVPFININKARLNAASYILYESIVDKINYLDFFEEFNLPDTFYSWFVITELHLWMLMVRCMAEGDEGRFVRNRIVQVLWSDVGIRVKQLDASNPAGMRKQVGELSKQFQAALIAYDEGLQSDDMVLAGAIWRRMYQQGDVDPENIDVLVMYIRKHIQLLDNISKDKLFSQKMSWESLVEK